MRLKIADGLGELGVISVTSASECEKHLSVLLENQKERLGTGSKVDVFVWHCDSWWDLTNNLPAYYSWCLQTGHRAANEAQHLIHAPLSHSDLLYEAALQMERLLSAAIQEQGHGKKCPSW